MKTEMGQYGTPSGPTGGLYALIAIPLPTGGGCSHCGGGHGNEFHGTTKRPGYEAKGSLYENLDSRVGPSRQPQGPQNRSGSYLDQKMDDPIAAFASKHHVQPQVAAHYLAAERHIRQLGFDDAGLEKILPGYFALLGQAAPKELHGHYDQLAQLAFTMYGVKHKPTLDKLH